MDKPLAIIIACDNASTHFGGEAILPYHYFRLLLERHIDVHLVVHARCREELCQKFPQALNRLHFIEDNRFELYLYQLGLNPRLKLLSPFTEFLRLMIFYIKQRQAVQKLIKTGSFTLIHQPIPVSPKQPSYLFNLGVPLIIGPMNGGMIFPPGMPPIYSFFSRFHTQVGRFLAHILNFIIPGKRQAKLLLAANKRTQEALPFWMSSPVKILVENGVDLNVWKAPVQVLRKEDTPVRFVYLGRLIELKGVDYLVSAFAKVKSVVPDAELHFLGDGPLMEPLKKKAQELGCAQSTYLHGFVDWWQCEEELKRNHVMVFPSLAECGGAAVLEGMASGLPVIATDWGGPKDYLDTSCGILVAPLNAELFEKGLADAMIRLAKDPQLCYAMGQAGRAKVVQQFDWNKKVDQILDYYRMYAE